MTTRVEQSIMVNVPVSVAYNQWTQFEEFPQFMGGVTSVTQLSDDRLEWVAEIAGVRRTWEAQILEQMPDRKVAWAASQGATNAGSVEFEDVGGGQTSVRLFLEYEPEGLVEKVGDKLDMVERQAESDLQRFKTFIEAEGYATGAWRGQVDGGGHVGTPGIEQAGASRGDSGKAGVSGKVAAGLGAAALAGAAAVAASRTGSGEDSGPVQGAEVEGVAAGTVPPDQSGAPAAMSAEAQPADYAGEPTYGGLATGGAGAGAGDESNASASRSDAVHPASLDEDANGSGTDPMDEIYAASDELEDNSKRP